MSPKLVAVTGVTVLLGLTLACTSNSSTPLTPTTPSTTVTPSTAADGSTLKVTAPVAQSPVGGVKPETGPATLVVSAATAQFTGATPVQYRFQVFNGANAIVENVLVNSTSHPIDAELAVNATYSWQARAEYQGRVGPWSTKASFVAPESAFLGVQTFADPLTNGRTVGQRQGGTFILGQGWQSLGLSDGIDYDLKKDCHDCKLEFDVTNFGPQEGLSFEKDLKWISMGDATTFGSFGQFRDHPWKMHLIERADYPHGMEIVWRNGGTDPNGGDPGDHRIKLNDTPITFRSTDVYHFQLDWGGFGYTIAVNGIEVLSDGWDNWYEVPNFRVSLGCYPRAESIVGAIYRNIKLTKHSPYIGE
jgi:hypothetical protein